MSLLLLFRPRFGIEIPIVEEQGGHWIHWDHKKYKKYQERLKRRYAEPKRKRRKKVAEQVPAPLPKLTYAELSAMAESIAAKASGPIGLDFIVKKLDRTLFERYVGLKRKQFLTDLAILTELKRRRIRTDIQNRLLLLLLLED